MLDTNWEGSLDLTGIAVTCNNTYTTNSTPAPTTPNTVLSEVEMVWSNDKLRKTERRREQNRAAQRTYRERRENQLRFLETQNAMWQEKYEALLATNRQQKVQLVALNRRLATLQSPSRVKSTLSTDPRPTELNIGSTSQVSIAN
ncbi:hypothetical protein BP6252_06685 [Coleophoma cylindrospora]|uniref:BZIP domain-containing protein n=1 Tax=Coleophoma cylindrospora TaxID=1849047 RepID=A0A3D8RNC3_9HELO|nr:hypothetical protein BP6252_06685 [Coleophoma cylindrospora]